jgi:hypothetical protein
MSKSNRTEDRFGSKAKRFEKHNRALHSTKYCTKYHTWSNPEEDDEKVDHTWSDPETDNEEFN